MLFMAVVLMLVKAGKDAPRAGGRSEPRRQARSEAWGPYAIDDPCSFPLRQFGAPLDAGAIRRDGRARIGVTPERAQTLKTFFGHTFREIGGFRHQEPPESVARESPRDLSGNTWISSCRALLPRG